MKSIKDLVTGIAAGALMIATPAAAQDEFGSEEMTEQQMAEFGALFGSMFQAEPLTLEQEARLPAAQRVVGLMLPDGFYGKMMADTIGPMFDGIFSMFGGPDMIVSSKFVLSDEQREALSDAQMAEIAGIVDPAYESRGGAISDAMNASMTEAFAVMESPMRDGLSRAYAARFDDTQLADIAAFFATPTGQVYAPESMALFSDPQVMQSMMGTLPVIMQSFGGMEKTIEDAMAALPKEKGYADLSASEKSRLAQLLGLSEAELEQSMLESATSTVEFNVNEDGDWEE